MSLVMPPAITFTCTLRELGIKVSTFSDTEPQSPYGLNTPVRNANKIINSWAFVLLMDRFWSCWRKINSRAALTQGGNVSNAKFSSQLYTDFSLPASWHSLCKKSGCVDVRRQLEIFRKIHCKQLLGWSATLVNWCQSGRATHIRDEGSIWGWRGTIIFWDTNGEQVCTSPRFCNSKLIPKNCLSTPLQKFISRALRLQRKKNAFFFFTLTWSEYSLTMKFVRLRLQLYLCK